MNPVLHSIKLMPLEYYIIFCSLLFTIGVIGVLIKRSALVIFMSVELMLNAVNLLLTAFSVYHNDASGQVAVIFIMVVAAAEVTVGLAILVLTYRNTKSIDMNLLTRLKG
jgi:NADH-quinone oxidoreductase subunit K